MWAFLERGSEDEDVGGEHEEKAGGKGVYGGMLPQLAGSKKLKVRQIDLRIADCSSDSCGGECLVLCKLIM